MSLVFKENTAGENEILLHLNTCSNSFIPPLHEKMNLIEYSKKIAERAIKFEVWDEQILIGIIAAYFNDSINYSGFITNVSVIDDYKDKGLASKLMNMCINYAQKNNFKEIKLEVNFKNFNAIKLYNRFNFSELEKKNDTILMICKLKNE